MRLIDANALKKRLIKRRDEIAEKRMFGWEFEYNGFNGAILLTGVEAVTNPVLPESLWIPVLDGDGEMPPVDEDGCSEYILVSFSNVPCLDIAQYRVDENGGAFYSGDDADPYTSIGIFVNAWMPLPKSYRKEDT